MHPPPAFLFERVTLVAPLGVRLWDVVSKSAVRDGLVVTAAPAGDPTRQIMATASPSGAFSFAYLPGLGELARGEGDQDYWSNMNPAHKRNFRLSITDAMRRFLPYTIAARAPNRGVYDLVCAARTVPLALPAGMLPLFSSATRPVPAGVGAIRAELRQGASTLAWAIVQAFVSVQGSSGAPEEERTIGLGMADAEGRVAVLCQYPTLRLQEANRLEALSWGVNLRVFAHTGASRLDPDAPPDLCAALSQPALAPSPLPARVTLRYGQDLVLR